MEDLKPYLKNTPGINIDALNRVAEKHAKINALIESGQPIDAELSKNFVTFNLPDYPYQK